MATLVTIGHGLDRGPRTINLDLVTTIEWYGMVGAIKSPTGALVRFAFDDDVGSDDHVELESEMAIQLWQVVNALSADRA
jgi:hypothetical protein